MHMHPCMRAYATVQKLLCHRNYCELIWVLRKHRANCLLPPALLLSRRNQSPDAVQSSLQKSVWIHASSRCGCRCGFVQASFDHPRSTGCRLHWVCPWFALETWPRGSPYQEFNFCWLFERVFPMHNIVVCIFSIFDGGWRVCGYTYVYVHARAHTHCTRFIQVSPGIGKRHLESRKNSKRLDVRIHKFVYVYEVHIYTYMLGGRLGSSIRGDYAGMRMLTFRSSFW